MTGTERNALELTEEGVEGGALSVSSDPSGSCRGAAGVAGAGAGAGPGVEPLAGSGERAGSGCGADAAAAADWLVELVVSSAYLAVVWEEEVWGCCWVCEHCRS